ncbi:neuropeptide FF receptor 2-like [Dendronephthya gigantea]|uniref:neuropeptide FF receptor 2-like n=1 Tax=Dendronephthya gigantea TaxID=151771 RepID=UPI0010694D78|nr:neuropeptide FF receptor 2-like [Dendronephthya gigantea]
MKSHNKINTTPLVNDTAGGDEVHYYLFITQIACYCVISVVGSLANMVICVGLSRGRLKSTEYFILNLAVADLLVCVIGIPLDIYHNYADSWPYGPLLCHVIYPLQTCLVLISILTLMAMSLERHRAICSPLKQRVKPKWLRFSIVCIWLIAIAAVIPYAKILKYTENDCLENWSVPNNAKYYTLALFIMDYCIPLTIITYCYTRSGYVLYKEFKKLNRKESTSSREKFAIIKRLRQKKKVIKIFSFAVILFVICVLPGDCYWMWFSFRPIKSHLLDTHLQAFSTITLYANSAINPFIFGALKMIRQRNLKSRFGAQLSGTNSFSGNISSAERGEGLNRKQIKYKNVKSNIVMVVQNTNSQVGGEKVESRYRDKNSRFRKMGLDIREKTSKKLRNTITETKDI